MANYLTFNADTAIQYGQFTGGSASFSTIFPNPPTAGEDKKIGLFSQAKGAGIYFHLNGTAFNAVATDGTNTKTVEITWGDWEDTEPIFLIRWEAGLAHFYIAGTKVAMIAFADENILLANTPLALYISNANSDELRVGFIEVTNAGSYITNR